MAAPPLGVTLVHWAPWAVCAAATSIWRHLAVPLCAPRVASGAALVLVDGTLVATHVGVDVRMSPALLECSTLKIVAETSTHVDVHVSDADLDDAAEIRVDLLTEGIIRPLKWQRAAIARLEGAQRVVSPGDMHCETAWRIHVPATAAAPKSLAAYRLRIRGVHGALTRIQTGRAHFPNGPFAAEIRSAEMCVRVTNADIFVSRPVACVAERPPRALRPHILTVPIDAQLVLVRYDSPVSFSHIAVAPEYSVKALLSDGSVVTVTPSECGCSGPAPSAVALSFALVAVVELRFSVPAIRECSGGLGVLLGGLGGPGEGESLRVIREPDGGVALLACAAIIVG
jgi:hypothetical protein